jgi:glucose-6-phosphate isomerase
VGGHGAGVCLYLPFKGTRCFASTPVFTRGTIWQIDCFDQWGVELGKARAQHVIPRLEGSKEPQLEHDSSTNALIRNYRRLKGAR